MTDDSGKTKSRINSIVKKPEDKTSAKFMSTAMDSGETPESLVVEKKSSEKKTRLTLDETNITKTRTRTELAAELSNGEDEKTDEDKTIILASVPKRAIALMIDLLFMGFLYLFVFFSTPLFRKFIQIFMDRYKRQFIFPEYIVMNALFVIIAFITIFFFIAIPAAFFNRSLGKKMLGLKLRSEERYNISLTQAMQREYVYKPLSILVLLGFFIPFFNKNKQSLHDFLATTLVVDEKENKI